MNEMDLFEGLKWMHEHPGEELDTIEDGDRKPYKSRILGSLLEWRREGGKWYPWAPVWSRQYRFRLPERKLPELPEGDVWKTMLHGLPYIDSGKEGTFGTNNLGVEVYRRYARRYQALIEEIETRTGEQK